MATCAAAGVATAAVAASPTGDPATIAFVRAIASNTNLQPAIVLHQTGYMTESRHVGTPTSFTYQWGFGGVPSGSVRAAETITYVQRHGRVVWLTDVLHAVATSCAPGAACPPAPAPIQLFVTTAAAFAGVVDRPHGVVACYEHVSFNSVPYRAGQHWWTAVGDYRPKVTHGNQTLVTDTYSWADGQHVTEVDSIDNKGRLFHASVFHVARGSTPREVAFSFAQRDTALARAPHAPSVTRCS